MTPSTPPVVAPAPHEVGDPAAAQAVVVEVPTVAEVSADGLTAGVPLTAALPAAPRGASPPAAVKSAAPPRRAALSLLTSILRERARLP